MNNRYTYTIDENNAILIFDAECSNENGAPNLFQPFHPATPSTLWASREEADSYAKQWIEELINPVIVIEPEEEVVTND
jgi:hypothetical protein